MTHSVCNRFTVNISGYSYQLHFSSRPQLFDQQLPVSTESTSTSHNPPLPAATDNHLYFSRSRPPTPLPTIMALLKSANSN